jgi:hypothetical protein
MSYLIRKKGRTVARAKTLASAKAKAIKLGQRRQKYKHHFIAKVRKGRKHLLYKCDASRCEKVKAYGTVVP